MYGVVERERGGEREGGRGRERERERERERDGEREGEREREMTKWVKLMVVCSGHSAQSLFRTRFVAGSCEALNASNGTRVI